MKRHELTDEQWELVHPTLPPRKAKTGRPPSDARLMRHCDSLFTFLDHPDVPYENNHAERMIRPAVIIRKNSQSNRSDKGTSTQAILMSIFRTLKLRGHDPLETVVAALRTYTAAGHLPPLPVQSVADG